MLNLERYREEQHGPRARMTHKFVNFLIYHSHKFIVSDNDQPTVFSCVLLVEQLISVTHAAKDCVANAAMQDYYVIVVPYSVRSLPNK